MKQRPNKTNEPSTDDKKLAALILDRKLRVERAEKVVSEIFKKERCAFCVTGLNFNNGSVIPVARIVALE
jgi:hypothetical protein